MNDTTAIRHAVDRILVGDLEPMLDLLAEDVEFQVALGGETNLCREETGKQAAASYFRMLGGMVSFWQLDYTAGGQHLIAWGRESFTVEPCGIEASSEFALVFDVSAGLISRLLVVEDLPSFIGSSSRLTAENWKPEGGSWDKQPEEFSDLVGTG